MNTMICVGVLSELRQPEYELDLSAAAPGHLAAAELFLGFFVLAVIISQHVAV